MYTYCIYTGHRRDPRHPQSDGGDSVQVRVQGLRDLPLNPPGREHRRRQLLGARDQRPDRGARAQGLEVLHQRRRRRLLRPQDRPQNQGLTIKDALGRRYYIFLCICTYMCVCIYTYFYIYIYIYIFIFENNHIVVFFNFFSGNAR